ncbi:MAG: hypothetical protein MZV64_59940 [Ignavibacteriales bacterium]|nr:hypothetical protein [Ignavibacteriales bacterium]
MAVFAERKVSCWATTPVYYVINWLPCLQLYRRHPDRVCHCRPHLGQAQACPTHCGGHVWRPHIGHARSASCLSRCGGN